MKIHPKMKAEDCSQHFSHYKSMEIFFSYVQGVANSAEPSPILLSFEPIQAFIAVPVTCKNEYDPIKNGKIFPIITLWELSVAMETRVLIRSCPKPNSANPPP